MGMRRSLKFGNALEFFLLLLRGGCVESLLDQIGYGVGVDLAGSRGQNLQQGRGSRSLLAPEIFSWPDPRTPISAVPSEY